MAKRKGNREHRKPKQNKQKVVEANTVSALTGNGSTSAPRK